MGRTARLKCPKGEEVPVMKPDRGPAFWSKDNLVRFADTQAKHGRIQKIIRNTHKVIEWKLENEDWKGDFDTALIIADTETSPIIYHTVAGVLPEYGIQPSIALEPQRPHPNAPLQPPIVESINGADLIINLATYTVTHSPNIIKARKNPDKGYILIPDATEDSFARGMMDADPAVVQKLNNKVGEILRDGEWARVTSDQGCDMEFSLEECPEYHLSGFPLGETNTLPQPMESINGKFVVDSFMMMVGMIETPIEMTVEEGWITEIKGGQEARQLQGILDEHGDENANAFAEFSIMTNPKARPNGNLIEHKMVAGGVHMAVGSQKSWDGIESNIHLDGVLIQPTVEIDDEVILDQGEFQIEI